MSAAEKTHYAALGVSKSASAAEIKKAYRKLAKALHPDNNPDDRKAEARFKEVSEAYDVLSDPTKRREYDEAQTMFRGGPRTAGSRPGGAQSFDFGGGGADFGSMFEGLFGDGARRRGGGSGRAPRRGEDLAGAVTVSFEESFTGAEIGVRLPGAASCTNCHGSGAAPGTSPRTCPTCDGRGTVARDLGGFALSETCSDCRGRGSVLDQPCPVCGGTGTTERTQRIRVPAGVRDGQRLRVRGRGLPGERGAPSGDLEITVTVRPHHVFGRDGSSLTLKAPVTFAEAVLGANVTLPTLDGPVTVKVTPGSASGSRLRVRGRGFPRAGGRGDFIVTLEVIVPRELSEEATGALKAYAAIAPEAQTDPRAALTALVAPR